MNIYNYTKNSKYHFKTIHSQYGQTAIICRGTPISLQKVLRHHPRVPKIRPSYGPWCAHDFRAIHEFLVEAEPTGIDFKAARRPGREEFGYRFGQHRHKMQSARVWRVSRYLEMCSGEYGWKNKSKFLPPLIQTHMFMYCNFLEYWHYIATRWREFERRYFHSRQNTKRR